MDTQFLEVFICLLLHLKTSTSSAQTEWSTGATMPNPMIMPDQCGIPAARFVCNPDDMLLEAEVSEINNAVQAVISGTSCNCLDSCPKDKDGFIISVLVIKSLSGLSSTNTAEQNTTRVHDFTHDARAAWQLGTCDNDAMLMVATDQKQVWTNTGKNTKIALSDGCINAIFTKHKDLFSERRLADGINLILDEYRSSLKRGACSTRIYTPSSTDDQTEPSEDEPSKGLGSGAYIGIFVGGMILVVLLVVAGVLLQQKCDKIRGFRGTRGGQSTHSSANRYGGHHYYDDDSHYLGGGGGGGSGDGGGGGGGDDGCGGGGGSYD